jgi:hypothetical protein
MYFFLNLNSLHCSSAYIWMPYIETLSFQLSSQVQVEVDLLTEAITLLMADLMYVCGKSLNPAVDLG